MANPNPKPNGMKPPPGPHAPIPVTPELFAIWVDRAILSDIRRCLRGEPARVPPHLLAVAVGRIKDLGQTNEPESAKEAAPGVGLEAEMRAALEEE